MTAVYLRTEIAAKTIAKTSIKHHDNAVLDHPKRSEIRPIPYVDIAAPIYIQLLHIPPTVAALPVWANLPGRQEMRRKFTPCIEAQIKEARSRDIIPDALPSVPTKRARRKAHKSERENNITVPLA